MPRRTGVVFVDIATRGTYDPEQDEIIQLSAYKLCEKGSFKYNMYALPRQISRGDENKHGFVLDCNSNQLILGRSLVGPCQPSHKDLLVNFGVWLDVRYDEVTLVCMDSKKIDLLDYGFDCHVRNFHFRMPDVIFKNVQNVFSRNGLRWSDGTTMRKYTFEEILSSYDNGYRLKYDAQSDVKSLRRACIDASNDLRMNTREFIGDDSDSDNESDSGDENEVGDNYDFGNGYYSDDSDDEYYY